MLHLPCHGAGEPAELERDKRAKAGHVRASVRARLMATMTLRWCFEQVPEMRRGKILERSGANP